MRAIFFSTSETNLVVFDFGPQIPDKLAASDYYLFKWVEVSLLLD